MNSKIFKSICGICILCGTLTACDDQIMEWGTPEGHGAVTTSEIPLQVKEVLANYGNIKDYASQYMPQSLIGLGFGISQYNSDEAIRTLVNDNYQMMTAGNAMKHDAIVSNAGALNFATIDEWFDVMPSDMKLYGHNFFWHSQTRQAYLKSLITPTLVVESDSDIKSLLNDDSSDFENGNTGGWGSWGNSSSKDVANEGYESEHSMHLVNPSDANFWSAQCAYTFDVPLDMNTEYTMRFYAKSNTSAGQLQFQYQNSTTYGNQGAYTTFDVGTSWVLCEVTFTPAYEDDDRIIINFGQVAGEYWIDKIEFGTKQEDPMENVMVNDDSDFEGGSTGSWGSWGNSSSKDVVEGGYNGSSYCMHLNNPSDANFWSAQCAYTFSTPLDMTKKYIMQFYAKSSTSAGQLQFQYQNSSTYGSQGAYTTFNVGTDWILCEVEFTPAYDDADRIIINFGQVAGDYYIDNIKFGIAKNQDSEASSKQIRYVKRNGKHKARSYYVIKSDEEKNAALTGAMEAWVKGMAEHLAEKGVVPVGYDVINEAITDGQGNKIRGVDNVFGGSDADDDGNVTYDSEPVETEEDGLTLNWGSNRFYWGYYVKDYGVKAFQFARKYLPAETKLFINDYNLETSPSKLEAMINFAKSIDAANGSAIVDGLGTQMHVSLSTTDDEAANNEKIAALKTKVDAMFTTMAATGKLVRVTELDVALGTSSPSAAQYKAQAEAYKMIFESYKTNVPTAQQSGITIWSLSDNESEHEYWLNGDVPNLFDANYLRKWAYKGVCDGIAGEDLGLQYGGDDYKAYYEKQNVSDTVK